MLTDKHHIGVVGKNGTGKTTLLKIILGEEKPERGTVVVDPKSAKIAYHSQVLDTVLDEEQSVFGYLMSRRPQLYDVWKQLQDTDRENIVDVISEYTDLGGYLYEDRIVDTARKLKLDLEQKIGSLSGGQKTRLRLGTLLVTDHDILLLDEPTNHLDIEGIEWFYNYLEEYRGLVVIVSHDRNLLTRAVGKIIEIEDMTIKEYSGNYEYYKSRKLEERIAAEQRMRENERKVDQLNQAASKLDERVKRHEERAQRVQSHNLRVARLEKKNKSARTKLVMKKLSLYRDNDKLSANFKIGRQQEKLSTTRRQLLERASDINKPKAKIGWNMKIDFHVPVIEGDFAIRVKNVSKNYGERNVLENISFYANGKDKVHIKGPNGSGKTTLLRSILGEIEHEGLVELSSQAKVGYLTQENTSLNPENTALGEFMQVAKNIPEGEARAFLHFFLFEGDMPLRKIKSLSEGEKLKLKLAKLLYATNNILLLDEPTNHLDIPSQEVIEKALKDYDGCLILVSHDEELVKSIGVTKTIELP